MEHKVQLTEKETAGIQKVKTFLDSISPQLVAELKLIISGDYGLNGGVNPAEVALLTFEVCPQRYDLVLYPFDANHSQVGFKELPESGGLIENDILLKEEEYFDIDNEEKYAVFALYLETVEPLFFSWFIDAWDKAVGAASAKPAFIQLHDSGHAFDLIHKKWVRFGW